jgi:hypothetical protein
MRTTVQCRACHDNPRPACTFAAADQQTLPTCSAYNPPPHAPVHHTHARHEYNRYVTRACGQPWQHGVQPHPSPAASAATAHRAHPTTDNGEADCLLCARSAHRYIQLVQQQQQQPPNANISRLAFATNPHAHTRHPQHGSSHRPSLAILTPCHALNYRQAVPPTGLHDNLRNHRPHPFRAGQRYRGRTSQGSCG